MNTQRTPLLLTLLLAVLIALPSIGNAMQSSPSQEPAESFQANPTQTPTPRVPAQIDDFQANPTEPPRTDIDDFQANPTEPPRTDIDDLQANPTEPPRTDIDDLQANPTEPSRTDVDDLQANPTEPSRTDIDDLQANPTEAPEGTIDTEAIPPPPSSSIMLVKRDCPIDVPEDAYLSDYLVICSEPHDDVEFTLSVNGESESATTENGELQWSDLIPEPFTIQETIPDGYSDPIVFCGYTESPGGGVQHPARVPSEGGLVSGSISTIGSEYVCYWFNIKQTTPALDGPERFADPSSIPGASLLMLQKHVCPSDILRNQTLDYYFEQCTGSLDGAQFTLSTEDGEVTKPVVDGQIQWPDLSEGTWTLAESTPPTYSDPIVFCGWTAYYNGAILDAFAQEVSVTNGVVEGEISYPGTYAFCFWMNVMGGPGDIVSPDGVTNDLVVRTWDCPNDVARDASLAYYARQCSISSSAIDLTLNDVNGSWTTSTENGFASWDNVPLGTFTVDASLPVQSAEPIVFCGWTATWGGFIYDAFPQIVDNVEGSFAGEITVPNTQYFCDLMNVSGTPDDISG